MKALTLRLTDRLFERLNKQSYLHKTPKSAIIRAALSNELDIYEKRPWRDDAKTKKRIAYKNKEGKAKDIAALKNLFISQNRNSRDY